MGTADMSCLRRLSSPALLAALLALVGCTAEAPAPTHVQRPASPGVARGKLSFVEGYHQGYEQALREGKPMLVFFTAQWCGFCTQLANEAFTNEQVVALSERFVCILVDADREPDVCREFRVRGYPTIQFLSPRGVPLNRVTGKRPGHQLVIEMQSALQAVARRVDVPSTTRRF